MNQFDDLLNTSAKRDKSTEAFVIESKENRAYCFELLDDMAVKIASSEELYKQFLTIQGKFDRYTANNALLILGQQPDAQRVGDYGFWRDQGVYIQRQEKNQPILILEPGSQFERKDGSIGTFYNAKKVYDIKQTTMQEKISPQIVIDERLLIRALIHQAPVSLQTVVPDNMKTETGAFFDLEKNCIFIKQGMESEDIFRSVSKELVHAHMAQEINLPYNRHDNEFRAQSVSYLLCKKYGVDTKPYRFEGIQEFFNDLEPKEIRKQLSEIRDTASELSSRMYKAIEQGSKKREQEYER